MLSTNHPASGAAMRPATSLRQAVRRHREVVATGARALQEWSASTADDDHALDARLADIRERLSTALQPSAIRREARTLSQSRRRPRLRVVGSDD